MNNERYNAILSDLDENGGNLIEEGLKGCNSSMYDLYLFYDENGKIHLGYDYYGNSKENELYNFGNCQDEPHFHYEQIHNEFLKIGLTKTDDFETWFDEECCLDADVNTIYEIVENNIHEIFSSEQNKKRILHSWISMNCEEYLYSHDFDIEDDFSDLCDQFLYYVEEEINKAKAENNTSRIYRFVEYKRIIIDEIKND